MTLDISLFYLLNNLAGRSAFIDGSIVFFASYLAYLLIIIFFAFLVFSSYEKREKIHLFLVALIACVVARAGITELIRFFYHRPRPFIDLPTHQLLTDSAWSFPSGHATFFFALSTVVYLYNKKWGIGFFIATILMTLGRVAASVHYPSDILAGAIIGIVVGYSTFLLWRKVGNL